MKINSQICDEISVKINSQISYIKRVVQPTVRKLQPGWTVEEIQPPEVIMDFDDIQLPNVVVVSDKEPIIIELSVSLCVDLWRKKLQDSSNLTLEDWTEHQPLSNFTFEEWVEHQNGLVIGWSMFSRQIKFNSEQDYLIFAMKYL